MEVADGLNMVADAVKLNAGVKPEELVDLDRSMGPFQFWMTSLVLLCSLLVLLATFGAFAYKNLLTYRGKEGNALVRGYLQKMAVYNLLILAILYLTYAFLFDGGRGGTKAGPEQCFQIDEHKLITFLVVFGSAVVGLIRFLAVGFAHSETHDFGSGNVQQGFSVQTNHIYKGFVSPYTRTAFVGLRVVLAFLHAPLPGYVRDPVLGAEFCLSSWLEKDSSHPLLWRLLPILVIILLPVISATIIEHFAHIFKNGFFTEIPGYYSILNAPFIMVALTTTWSMWFAILFVVWLNFGLGAGEYFSILALFYTSCDSLALLVAAVIVGRKNRFDC